MWVKEKLLVTSNSSFSHSVFKRLVSQGRQQVSLCGNGLNMLNVKHCPIGPSFNVPSETERLLSNFRRQLFKIQQIQVLCSITGYWCRSHKNYVDDDKVKTFDEIKVQERQEKIKLIYIPDKPFKNVLHDEVGLCNNQQ